MNENQIDRDTLGRNVAGVYHDCKLEAMSQMDEIPREKCSATRKTEERGKRAQIALELGIASETRWLSCESNDDEMLALLVERLCAGRS